MCNDLQRGRISNLCSGSPRSELLTVTAVGSWVTAKSAAPGGSLHHLTFSCSLISAHYLMTLLFITVISCNIICVMEVKMLKHEVYEKDIC